MGVNPSRQLKKKLRQKLPGYCRATSNPCGTDTWVVGSPCQCVECQKYLRDLEDKGVFDVRFPSTSN